MNGTTLDESANSLISISFNLSYSLVIGSNTSVNSSKYPINFWNSPFCTNDEDGPITFVIKFCEVAPIK